MRAKTQSFNEWSDTQVKPSPIVEWWEKHTKLQRGLAVGGATVLLLAIILTVAFTIVGAVASKNNQETYDSYLATIEQVNKNNQAMNKVVTSKQFGKEMLQAGKKAPSPEVKDYAKRMHNAYNVLRKDPVVWKLEPTQTDASALSTTIIYFAITDETQKMLANPEWNAYLRHYDTFIQLSDLVKTYYATAQDMMTYGARVRSQHDNWTAKLPGVKSWMVFNIAKDTE